MTSNSVLEFNAFIQQKVLLETLRQGERGRGRGRERGGETQGERDGEKGSEKYYERSSE